MINTVINKSKFVLAAAMVVGTVAASVAGFASNNYAYAATNCDKVNIVYCGITGNDAASYIASFKNIYSSNKSGHATSPTVKKDYTDLKTVYDWAGVTSSAVSSMSTANTKVGTLYKDGRIVVDGKTVATNAWVSARFTSGSGFTHVAGNVYARKTTTSFAESSAKVLVHFTNNQMDFALMTDCANAVKATPIKPETPKTPETPVKTPKTPETPVVTTTAVTTPKATELPKTGPSEIIGLVSGVTLAGASAHRLFKNRKG
jgi:hypothetical protein